MNQDNQDLKQLKEFYEQYRHTDLAPRTNRRRVRTGAAEPGRSGGRAEPLRLVPRAILREGYYYLPHPIVPNHLKH